MLRTSGQRGSDIALGLAFFIALLIYADTQAILYGMDRMPIVGLNLAWLALWIVAIRLSRKRRLLLGLNAMLFAFNVYAFWYQMTHCPPGGRWCVT